MASSAMPGKRQPAPTRIGVTIPTGLTGALVSKPSVGPP